MISAHLLPFSLCDRNRILWSGKGNVMICELGFDVSLSVSLPGVKHLPLSFPPKQFEKNFYSISSPLTNLNYYLFISGGVCMLFLISYAYTHTHTHMPNAKRDRLRILCLARSNGTSLSNPITLLKCEGALAQTNQQPRTLKT